MQHQGLSGRIWTDKFYSTLEDDSQFSIRSHSCPRLSSQMKRLTEPFLDYLSTSSFGFDHFLQEDIVVSNFS